jgi:Tol biopolymer transport system component
MWAIPMTGEPKPFPVLQTRFAVDRAAFSPDVKWIAYQSNESGKFEVYVQPFPTTGAKWQISTAGGTLPKWRGDGRELFYLSADRKLMAVDIGATNTIQAGIPKPLFETRIYGPFLRFLPTRDGQRFLIPTPVNESDSTAATIVFNWPKEGKP